VETFISFVNVLYLGYCGARLLYVVCSARPSSARRRSTSFSTVSIVYITVSEAFLHVTLYVKISSQLGSLAFGTAAF
jgi:hypothetical protein